MKNQHCGWLCIVSKKTLKNKYRILFTTENPDDLIQSHNEMHQYPTYKPYILEYKTYVTDLITVLERIHSALGSCDRNVWLDYPLSEITQIIENEPQATNINPQYEDEISFNVHPEFWAYNGLAHIPRGSDIYKIENIRKHYEITQKVKLLRKWRRKIEADIKHSRRQYV